ncbi:sensor histidine kinase [Halomonas caseinilytica]|uniref:sensor histidine kinase n=1 Tax=Halomonas caseinilytica TaxID=438744 RepID=UPI0007E5707C|nr:sensor histidine kinase N-terminal domain-containing protein [Halomonas caseinilytica]SEM93592.1 two-component system, OmpR family, sensor histidine kinase TctE [Halomonas caseinilytica]
MITRDSLYRRLLTWLLLPLLALGGLMLFQAWLDARQTADRAFDRLLEASTLAIAEQVQWQDERLWLDLPPVALEMLATDAEERVFYAIYDDRGRFVTGNAELPGMADAATGADDELHYRDIQWRGMALREGIRRTRLEDWRQRERFEVRVAHTQEGRERLAHQLLRGNLAYILGMALLAAAILVIAIRTALAPLTRLRRAIRARDPRTLAPLELPLPRELAELRETINELLARMRRVRANQERFIGDASHQLRTPLAGLSARAELALRQDDPAQWHQALVAMQETSARTSRLAIQLLSLTRLDNPEYRPELAPVALDELARRTVKQHWSACHRDGVDLGVEAPTATVQVQGLDWQLEEALGNLIDNGRRYGARRITVRVTDAPPVLEVEDDGPGIPATKRLLMLRPFHRGSDDPDGSGLGLAIVDGIARTHGARLSLEDGHDAQGLRVILRFPGDPR